VADEDDSTFGQFIRSQRELQELTMRQLADAVGISNPYLSQIERGLHEPSVRVLKAIATALNVSAESLLHQAGLLDEVTGGRSTAQPAEEPLATAAAIAADPKLTDEQRTALLAVYESYVAHNSNSPQSPAGAKKPRG
jgi:transcriptional regulator with XRE-family HTH domain